MFAPNVEIRRPHAQASRRQLEMLRVPDENNNNENTKYTTQPALIVSKQKK
jgi:hypothetical protein